MLSLLAPSQADIARRGGHLAAKEVLVAAEHVSTGDEAQASLLTIHEAPTELTKAIPKMSIGSGQKWLEFRVKSSFAPVKL